tara:strand:+ start:171 stop:1172 length:1002 start_codon:yes stop_codon:yes gene_type:complete
MNILLRTAGGASEKYELGTGHIFRCINLTKKLNKHKIIFAVEDFGGVKQILKQNNLTKIKFLKQDINENEDIKKITKIIYQEKIDLVIVDKFGIKKSYLRKLQKIITTVYISDLLQYEFPVDLVINGFIGLKNERKKNNFGANCILGPKYQILSNTHLPKKQKKKYDLLITLGGFDKNKILNKLCKILPKYLDQLQIRVILGPVTKKTKDIIKLEKEFPKTLSIIHYSKNIQKEIVNSKFGLCAGGITTYEFALHDVPFFITCQYNHQKITAEYWKKLEYCYGYILPHKKLEPVEIYLQKIINKKIIRKNRKIKIDNLGSMRVVKEILKLKII